MNVLTVGRARRVRAQIAALARIAPGDAVLDVGCGTGDLALLAAALTGPGGRVCAIDAAPEMIAVARRKAARRTAVDFRVAAVEALPFPDASFDVVLSSLLLHHLPSDIQRRGLAEIRRVLRPGGHLLAVDLRHPTSRPGRALLALSAHGGLRVGAQDLPPLFAASGFTTLAVGTLGHGALGYVRASVTTTAGAISATTGPAPMSPTAGTRPHDHARLNRILPHLLRSPFHRPLSGNLLLLTYTGRKTGGTYTIPVTYLQTGETIVVFSNQRWWRNLRGGAPVTLQLRGREVRGHAMPMEEAAIVAGEVGRFLARKGCRVAPMINVRLDSRAESAAAIAAATRAHVVIRITLAAANAEQMRG